jgi:hypothetical protein
MLCHIKRETNMAIEIKDILKELLEGEFFKYWRTMPDVTKKLAARGLTVKGKRVGMVSRMLTKMCQDSSTSLEREEIPKEERTNQDKWKYKKVR